MKKINNYIIEKLKINKDSFDYSQEAYDKILHALGLPDSGPISKVILEWLKREKIQDVSLYIRKQDFINYTFNLDEHPERKEIQKLFVVDDDEWEKRHQIILNDNDDFNCDYESKGPTHTKNSIWSLNKILLYETPYTKKYIIIIGDE